VPLPCSKLPISENATLGRKVNFASGKIPLGDKSPGKSVYSVPAQEMAKHRAKFGRPLLSDIGAVMKPRRKTVETCWGAPNSPTDLSR